MTQRTTGRHRRPGRLSTASTALTRTAAVAATSTGLIAGAVTSANAAPEVPQEQGDALLRLGATVAADRTVTVDRPAKATPAPEEVDLDGFGTKGFTAVTPVVEEAAPAVEETSTQEQATQQVAAREDTSASRDNERQAQPAAQPQPEPEPEPAPAPAPPPAPAPTGGVLGVAAAYSGYPYAWGGTSPATGFDCSGYTSYVFAQVGISLPRTAAAQQASAVPVSNPQPGDLIFFGYPAYHVGIYAGGGMMYDSGRPGILTGKRAIFSGVSGYGRVG